MFAEIQHIHVDELARRLREQHLAAVTRGGNAGAQMHVLSHVARLGKERPARVHAHAYADGAGGERALRCFGSRNGGGRAAEDVEEGISLRVNLDAGVGRERIAQEPAVLA